MNAIRNDLAGSAVFWTLGDGTDFAKLEAALQQHGFHKFTPEKMTDYAALKQALEDEFPDCQVFPIKGRIKETFEIVRIKRDAADDKRNEYSHLVTASADRRHEILLDQPFTEMKDRIQSRFHAYRQTVPYSNVSRCLVEIVFALKGTALRPSGGIYWVTAEAWGRWETLAKSIEMCGAKNKVFALRTVLDEYSAVAIREALTLEIARESKAIEEKLKDITTGSQAAASARQRARDLRNKIGAYEESFAMMMPDLKRSLDEATGQEAIAALLDSALSNQSLQFTVN